MGDIFKTTSQKTSTVNQQVGVSGSGVGQSGTIGGSQAAQGATATGAINTAGGSVSFVTSDIAAMEANQAVSLGAVNAAHQIAINALQATQASHSVDAQTVQGALLSAGRAIESAVPTNTGDLAALLGGQQKQLLTMAAIVAVVLIVGYIATKSAK
jgi:hypothetical protein